MATNILKPVAVTSKKPAPKPKSAYAANKAFAEQMSGYNASSPIWNKPLVEVLDLIEKNVVLGGPGHTKVATELIGELRKRIAKGKIMKAQS